MGVSFVYLGCGAWDFAPWNDGSRTGDGWTDFRIFLYWLIFAVGVMYCVFGIMGLAGIAIPGPTPLLSSLILYIIHVQMHYINHTI